MRRDQEIGNRGASKTLLDGTVKEADIEEETPLDDSNSLEENNSCCNTISRKIFFWRVRKRNLCRLIIGLE